MRRDLQKKSDASILEDSRTDPKEKSVKASPPSYMDRVYQFSLALGDDAATARLSEPRDTPELRPKESAHLQVLCAASALIDAVILECDGSNREAAVELASGVFDAQAKHGFMRLSEEPRHNEFLTTAFGAFWDVGMAAILYVAWKHQNEIPGIFEKACNWWRTYFDYLTEGACGFTWPSGTGIRLTPCLRGGSEEAPEKAACRDRDEILEFIAFGRKTGPDSERDLTGLRIFHAMENVPLMATGRFHGPRWQREGGVRYLQSASGLQAQWMVGTGKKPAGAIDVPGGWAVVASGPAAKTGGECPVEPPEGA